MDTLELVQRLAVALAIGMVIGLERGWTQRAEPEGGRAAGIRTMSLAGLLGGTWGALVADQSGAAVVATAIAFAAFSGVLAVFRYRETEKDGTLGATTVVAGMLAFALGALAGAGHMQAAAAAGVAVAALLALKPALHGWLARLTWPELRSALLLLAMTVVMLPLLPDRAIDRWGALNPYALWLMTILLAAVSFAGYVAVRLFGDRGGIAITGIAGGLASSTAVTLTMARLARDQPGQRDVLLAGALASSTMMMMRVLGLATVIKSTLLEGLAPPLAVAALVLGGSAAVLLWRGGPAAARADHGLDLGNPFELGTVLKLGALIAAIGVLARVMTAMAGDHGAYLLAAISGIADVDAITLSMARLAGTSIGLDVAARAILIVVAVNTVAKAALGWVVGGRRIGLPLAAVSGAALAAGALGWLLAPAA